MINNPNEQANINDLINKIKYQHSSKNKPSMPNSDYQPNSTDNLLQQFKSNFKRQDSSKENKPEINENLQQVKQQLQQKKLHQHNLKENRPEINDNLQQVKRQLENKQHNVSHNAPVVNENLQQFKQQLQQKKEEQRETITHQNQEEIRYTEQRKQQQQKLLIRQAEQWLKDLDECSDEGFWFESFSRSYPSRLDAAIEYLAVLNASS
ncbi:salt stress protein, Slr1339 family [Crocosphaera sp.]|uniref:salt stress protein, Slr1339 family n=1 Tax=Crocosphaera sp. TaxID=2729996 RepID=UPI003F273F68